MTATASKVLSVARSQIGYREGRNNDTKYGRWYGMNNTPWCAIFVSWVAATSGASSIIPKHAYTPAGADWFKARGRWGKTPRVGAVVYFDFPGDGVNRISHVGLVEKVLSDGSIYTIEGNTNDSGSREGNGVYRKHRKSGIAGYGYPAYTSPSTFPLRTGHVFGYRKSATVHNGTEGPVTAANVRAIQRRVRAKETGVFDYPTALRVKAWKIWKGLGTNSDVGPVVWAKMFPTSA